MRLWHKKLVSSLPRQQLVGQWRECCCIAANLVKSGTPNHILVNKMMDYPINHFFTYSINHVVNEMQSRGYNIDPEKFWKYFPNMMNYTIISDDELYKNWHNDRYYNQCYANLEEKFDCGGITENDWNKINGK